MYKPLIQCFLLAIVEGSIQLGGAKMHESFMRYKVVYFNLCLYAEICIKNFASYPNIDSNMVL